jgi:hypothetical protein
VAVPTASRDSLLFTGAQSGARREISRHRERALGAAPFFAPLKVRTPAQAIFGVELMGFLHRTDTCKRE